MYQLIFATNNQNKVAEIQSLVGADFNVQSLAQAGIDIDIPEPYDTFQENALTKAKTIHALTQQNTFSEDTGLEIEILHGAPGVKSARYAGDTKDFQANIDKVLLEMKDATNRAAQFRTVICLIWENQTHYFEGICKGQITLDQSGNSGFGYDPIFIPDGSNKRFAEMTLEEKNQFSHRQKAVTQLFAFLRSIKS